MSIWDIFAQLGEVEKATGKGTFKLFVIQLLIIVSIVKALWHKLHRGVAAQNQALSRCSY